MVSRVAQPQCGNLRSSTCFGEEEDDEEEEDEEEEEEEEEEPYLRHFG